MHTISFKVKPFAVDDNAVVREAFMFKKTVSRADCSMRPHDHRYYNSDLFVTMLNRVYNKIKGEYRGSSFIDDLPEGVEFRRGKFLSTVVINLPEDFK